MTRTLTRRGRALAAGGAAVLLLASTGCGALVERGGTYPSGDITFVIPYEPGGTSDPMGRAFARGLEKELGVSVVVENRPGGGATVGTAQTMGATPDGYEIGMSTNAALTYYPLVEDLLPWSTPADYQPIAKIGDQPAVLAVRADSPWQDLEDFTQTAEKEPGTLQVSSSGEGSSSDLIMREFVREAGLDIDVVPFSGGAGEAEVALLGGRVEGNVTFPAAVKGEVEAGRMRVIAVFQEDPLPLYPDATPTNSAGYDVDLTSSFYVIGPKGLPQDALEKLVEASGKVAHSQDFETFVRDNGSTTEVLEPDAVAAQLESQVPVYRQLID
jgi:tripartite-type tricarboxylate transporter receptor subunit TctC